MTRERPKSAARESLGVRFLKPSEDQARDHVNHDGNSEEDDPEFDQGVLLQSRKDLGEPVDDPARQGGAAREERSREQEDVPDHHRDGDRLTDRPPETYDDARDDPGPSRAEHGHSRRFPPSRSKLRADSR